MKSVTETVTTRKTGLSMRNYKVSPKLYNTGRLFSYALYIGKLVFTSNSRDLSPFLEW